MSDEDLTKEAIEQFSQQFMDEMNLEGKKTLIKIKKIVKEAGTEFEKVKEIYERELKIENFAKEIMEEMNLKGKKTLIKIKKIVKETGTEFEKIKTSFLRSTINERIQH